MFYYKKQGDKGNPCNSTIDIPRMEKIEKRAIYLCKDVYFNLKL